MNLNAAFMTSSGRRLQLGKVLGKGGEAKIFHVEGDSSIAIKIYADGKELDRRGKVNAMIADRLHNRTPFVAFPLETVTANGAFAGFTMRKAVGAKLMHQLCTPGDRKTEFPDANFRFLVRVALNFARAIASINNLGAVIGDINESGALVDQKGLVTIIDSDSFQRSLQRDGRPTVNLAGNSRRQVRILAAKVSDPDGATTTCPSVSGHSH